MAMQVVSFSGVENFSDGESMPELNSDARGFVVGGGIEK
jgi:hypothetical protein